MTNPWQPSDGMQAAPARIPVDALPREEDLSADD
jgi:hypothetical protein